MVFRAIFVTKLSIIAVYGMKLYTISAIFLEIVYICKNPPFETEFWADVLGHITASEFWFRLVDLIY